MSPSDAEHEQPRLKARYVFIDTSAYRPLQFDWSGRWLTVLADFVRRGLIKIVITDITKREIVAHLRESWSTASKSAKRSAVALRQLGLGQMLNELDEEEASIAKLTFAFEEWLRINNVWTCRWDPDLKAVMEDYFSGSPPFGLGQKKCEFPDAFVASALREWCKSMKLSVYVVSQDTDLKSCCSPDGPLIYASSIAEIISHGTVSAKIHDAVVAAVKGSDRVFLELQRQVTAISVDVESGYRGDTHVTVDASVSKLDQIKIDDVSVVEFDGTAMTCTLSLWGKIVLLAHIMPDDSNYTWQYPIEVCVPLNATVIAKLTPEGSGNVELDEVILDDSKLEVS